MSNKNRPVWVLLLDLKRPDINLFFGLRDFAGPEPGD